MSKGRVHYPNTAGGRVKASRKVGGDAPGRVAAQWPSKGRMPANTTGYRCKPQPTHPGCSRSVAQHWTGLIVQWKAQGLTAEVVRTTYGDSEDVTVQCAVANYLKLARRNQL